jgi:hypothetical protein
MKPAPPPPAARFASPYGYMPVECREGATEAALMQARLAEARRNHRHWVRQLAKLPDRKLSRRLDVLRQQQAWAWEQGRPLALQLLQLYVRQTQQARLLKMEG